RGEGDVDRSRAYGLQDAMCERPIRSRQDNDVAWLQNDPSRARQRMRRTGGHKNVPLPFDTGKCARVRAKMVRQGIAQGSQSGRRPVAVERVFGSVALVEIAKFRGFRWI